MQRLPKIPVHDPAFDDDDVLQNLANESNWFSRGSWLLQAAEAEFDAMAAMDQDRSTLYVGEPIAALLQPADRSRSEREITATMLYGMAVECWLKGLILMALRRTSPAAHARIGTALAKKKTRDLPDDEDIWETFQILGNAPFKKRWERYYTLRKAEDELRRDILMDKKKCKTHDLVKLAVAAKLNSRLAKQDIAFLDLLTKANQLGRYPVPFFASGVVPFAEVAGDKRRRERINRVVNRRYDALLMQKRQGPRKIKIALSA